MAVNFLLFFIELFLQMSFDSSYFLITDRDSDIKSLSFCYQRLAVGRVCFTSVLL